MTEDGHVTWRELLAETTSAVGDAQHARWICETAASATPAELLELLDAPATDRMVQHLDAMVARAQTGEPLQYVLGHWGFRRLDLAVDRRVLIPRPETELVAGVAIELARACAPERTVADLGTGSGAIGLALADELPLTGTTVWLTDRSPDALDVARANLAGIGRAAENVRIAEGDWCAALPDDLDFDVIVSNPPYVGADDADVERLVTEWEPASALFAGPDGLDAIRAIVDDAPDRLRENGWLVLEIGSGQGASVAALLAEAGYDDVEIRPDAAGLDRVAAARHPGR